MPIWSAEIKELETLHKSLQGHLPDLEKELEKLIKSDDENMVLLYARRCLEVIVTDLCECELKRPRKTEPLKGIIDKLNKEQKVPSHIIISMDYLNTLSSYGAHPKDFDPRQIKPVLNNLSIIIEWYLKYKNNEIKEQVKPEKAVPEGKPSEIESTKVLLQPKKRSILLVSGVLIAVAIIIAVLFLFNVIGVKKQTGEAQKSIAVLPFKLLSDEPDKQYLADGMMDAILLHLSKIENLRVMSRTSMEQYRKSDKTMPEIGREQGVEYLLEGSFQKSGDKVRLIVQLIKASKDEHIWADEYTRDWKDIFLVQSEVAQTIARELDAAITPEEKQLMEKTPTSSLTAYDFYQRGNEQRIIYLLDLSYNEAALDKAENLFREALKYDSSFARAFSGLAMVYIYKNSRNVESYFSENYLDSALILANKALSHDNQLAEAYCAKGQYYLATNHNDQALKEFDRALKYNPSYWEVYFLRGRYIYVEDYNKMDYVKAFEDVYKAISLNRGIELPRLLRSLGSLYISFAGFDKGYDYNEEAFKLAGDSSVYLFEKAGRELDSGNWKNAEELAIKVYKRDTNNVYFLLNLGNAYENTGRYKEALIYYKKYIERMKALGQLTYVSLHRIGYVYWQNGYKKEAEYYLNEQKRVCEEAIKEGRSYMGAYYDLAGVYAFLGKKEKAYENLRIWAKIPIPPSWWVNYIKGDHLFESIRNEPEFQQIVKDLETRYQAEHERVGKWMKEQGII